MASALIGNNNRLGGSKLIVPNGSHRIQLGTIGWGVTNPKLDQGVRRRILPEMPHKKAYDHGGLKNNPQMETVGYFSSHIDNMLGLPSKMLDELSVRQQRLIVKKRVQELRKLQAHYIRSNTKSPTIPIDTSTNRRLYEKQQQRLRTISKISELTPLSGKKTNLMQSSVRSRSHLPGTSFTTADSTKMGGK